MNRGSIIALVLAGIIFGCAVGMVAHEVVEPEAVAYVGQKWEYHCELNKKAAWEDAQRNRYNELGSTGWEMVGFEESLVCYKRPLP